MRDSFLLSFSATELDARDSLRAVIERLQAAGLSPERTGEIEIALTEAVNNVVEHAFAGDNFGTIRLMYSLRKSHLDIRIFDSGCPLPDERLPSGLAADVSVPRADLPEGGFGWFLIRELTSDIRYDRCEGSNQLSLRFEV